MYRSKDRRTRSLFPELFPFGGKLDENNRWLRIAELIPWEELLLDVPHRQVVFIVPKMLRLYFRYKRALLSPLSLAAVRTLLKYLRAVTGQDLMPGVSPNCTIDKSRILGLKAKCIKDLPVQQLIPEFADE